MANPLQEGNVPTYAYACTACDHRFEAQQSFSDDALTECPECAGKLRKLFNSVGIVFKGSGFYRTDSRGNGTSASSTSGSGDSTAAKTESTSTKDSSSSTSSGSSESSGSSSSTPAPSTTSSSSSSSSSGSTSAA